VFAEPGNVTEAPAEPASRHSAMRRLTRRLRPAIDCPGQTGARIDSAGTSAVSDIERKSQISASLPLFVSEPHACPYLPDRMAQEVFTIRGRLSGSMHRRLMDERFRRAGMILYRPACPSCRECVPIRVPVARFVASRSQRRVQRRNRDVTVRVGPLCADDEHWDLYRRYQTFQHDGKMLGSREEFEHLFGDSPTSTLEMRYRVGERLVGVGQVDVCKDALSSVYFYFDPAEARRSLGVFSGLCEIEECRRRGRAFWYVGFYVAGSPKMEYKARFRPCEMLQADGTWGSAGNPGR
jgi:arginyl-tRNA--protein-N-Asp/Glu arginylyltransferase